MPAEIFHLFYILSLIPTLGIALLWVREREQMRADLAASRALDSTYLQTTPGVAMALRPGPSAKQLGQYAEQARGCREAAANALTADGRERLLQMAERWEELARQRAAHLHLENVLAELIDEKTNGNHNGGAAAA
jgi:hypothetical protein